MSTTLSFRTGSPDRCTGRGGVQKLSAVCGPGFGDPYAYYLLPATCYLLERWRYSGPPRSRPL